MPEGPIAIPESTRLEHEEVLPLHARSEEELFHPAARRVCDAVEGRQ